MCLPASVCTSSHLGIVPTGNYSTHLLSIAVDGTTARRYLVTIPSQLTYPNIPPKNTQLPYIHPPSCLSLLEYPVYFFSGRIS